jgi:hypothetical protein
MQRSEARDTSTWGEVIVGTSTAPGVGYRATVWVSNVPLDLTRHLECAGVSAPTLQIAHSVSDDGTTILASAGMQLYLVTGFTSVVFAPSDINEDGVTNGIDLAIVLSQWGPCTGICSADINNDALVDGGDLASILGGWGPCP